MIGLPLTMAIFGCCRNPVTIEATDRTGEKLSSIIQLTSDVCMRYRLVADYFQRPQMNELFEKLTTEKQKAKVNEKTVKLTNSYFPKILGTLCIGGFICFEARSVLEGDSKL